MDLKRYTNKAQEALVGAQTLTNEFGHSQLEPLHLLTALMQQDEGVVPEVVAKIGGRPANLQQELEQMIQARPRVSGSNVDPSLSRDTVHVLNKAESEAKKLSDDYVSTEHILLALAEEKSVRGLLERHGVTRDSILKALKDIRGGQRVTNQDPESTYKSLENMDAI